MYFLLRISVINATHVCTKPSYSDLETNYCAEVVSRTHDRNHNEVRQVRLPHECIGNHSAARSSLTVQSCAAESNQGAARDCANEPAPFGKPSGRIAPTISVPQRKCPPALKKM